MSAAASPIPEAIRFLEAERARIDQALEVLRSMVPGNGQPKTTSPPPVPKKKAAKVEAAPVAEPPKKRRGKSVGGRLVPSDEGAEGIHTCPGCGREKLRKVPGPSGYMTFHYAQPCGLPCAASPPRYLENREDTSEGIHSKRNCPKCSGK